MAVRFLSEEWITEVCSRMNAHEGFKSAAKGANARVQQIVTDAPEGEVRYWIQLEDGAFSAGRGELDGPDATVTEDYETAVALNRSEMQTQAAFMQGKMKVAGNLMKLMPLQSVFGSMPQALADLDVEY